MRRLFDNLLCIVVTLVMFAFPVILLGLAPWIGESVLGSAHLSIGNSVHAIASAVALMMGSAGGLLLLALPCFVLLYMGLSRASRFSTRMLAQGETSARRPTSDAAPATATPGAATAATAHTAAMRAKVDRALQSPPKRPQGEPEPLRRRPLRLDTGGNRPEHTLSRNPRRER
ncbi:MAG: hypothetical protein KGI67_14465 [Pseudomonadota bacterium]|nr:hypothetical protein [Pseudomonadota bacterium]